MRDDVRKFDATPREYLPDGVLSGVIAGHKVSGAVGLESVAPVEAPRQFGVYETFGGRPRLESLARQPGTQPKQVGFEVTSVGYYCVNYAVMKTIPAEDMANADIGNRLVEGAAITLTNVMGVAVEDKIGTMLDAATAVGSVFLVGSAWDATANAGRAFHAVRDALRFCEDYGGYYPSVLLFGKTAWRAYSSNSSTIAAQGGFVTPERTAEAHGVSKVLVANNLQDASAEGLTLTPRAVFDDVIYGLRQPTNPNAVFEPRHSAVIYWLPSGERASVPGAFAAFRHPLDTKTHAYPVEVSAYLAPVIVDPKLGIAIKGCGSAQSGGLV